MGNNKNRSYFFYSLLPSFPTPFGIHVLNKRRGKKSPRGSIFISPETSPGCRIWVPAIGVNLPPVWQDLGLWPFCMYTHINTKHCLILLYDGTHSFGRVDSVETTLISIKRKLLGFTTQNKKMKDLEIVMEFETIIAWNDKNNQHLLSPCVPAMC